MKKCPYCAEEIQDEAIKCKHFGEWLKVSKGDTKREEVHTMTHITTLPPSQSTNNITKVTSNSKVHQRCDDCRIDYPAEEFTRNLHVCNTCVEKNLKNKTSIKEELFIPTTKSTPNKYKDGMLISLFLIYSGMLLVYLGNTNVIPKGFFYTAGATIETIGGVGIMVFVYKLSKIFEYSLFKRILITILSLPLNIPIAIYMYYKYRTWIASFLKRQNLLKEK